MKRHGNRDLVQVCLPPNLTPAVLAHRDALQARAPEGSRVSVSAALVDLVSRSVRDSATGAGA